VLVVDDAADARRLMCAALAAPGTEVVEAEDGRAALAAYWAALAADAPFDALVVDLAMPRMDGTALVRRIRDNEERERARRITAIRAGAPPSDAVPRVRIVGVTAYPALQLRRRELEEMADCVLEKPFSPEALRSAVRGTDAV
jgi:CheY-like chemotaxis protein